MPVMSRNLDVWLGKKQILHSVAFEANAGEVTMIIGPNGSGKTTLLRSLTGDIPHEGDITINGNPIRRANKAELARMRAVLAQHTLLSFPFTVAEVVEMGLRAGEDATLDAAMRSDHINAALQQVDLADFADRLCQELSGGEQQRVHLARVLCQIWNPKADGSAKWLFLDEPVASLDIRHQLQVMEIVQGFARRGGGVVAVMHDMNLAAMFGDRIVAMSSGKVVKSGSPETVLTNETLSDVFDCPLRVGVVPKGRQFVLPQSAAHGGE